MSTENIEALTNVEEVVAEHSNKEEVIETVESIPVVDKTKKVKKDIYSQVGYVYKCENLNLRAEPTVDSKVKVILKKNTMVLIAPELSTDTFYGVKANGNAIIGFCMKKFIKLSTER